MFLKNSEICSVFTCSWFYCQGNLLLRNCYALPALLAMSPGAEITAQDMWSKLKKWDIYVINKVKVWLNEYEKSNVNPTVQCTQKPHGVNYTSRVPNRINSMPKINVDTPAALSHDLKVPKREIFDRSDFPDFYTIKSSWVGDLLVKILTYYFNFWES